MKITRRSFIGAGVVAVGATAVPLTVQNLFGASTGGTFQQPKILSSSNGVLNLTLTAEAKMVPYKGGTRWALTYNGSTPGPTLVVKPGDTLKIKLVNKTGLPTNLHTHGLHVSPAGNSDNPLIMIDPNDTFNYSIKIPTNQRSGTFWYHPHHHEFVATQIHAGLFGAIIVKDEIDAQSAFANTTERVLIISDPRIGKDSSVMNTSMMDQMHGRSGNNVLVNGQFNPLINAKAGVTERWRIINAAPSRYLNLKVPGAVVTVLSTDGGRINSPKVVDSLIMTPGQRYEILVQPKKAGSLSLVNESSIIATLNTSKVSTSSFSPSIMGNVISLQRTAERKLTIVGAGMMGMGGGMGNHEMSFSFDGKAFDEKVVNQSVKLRSVEDWVIENTSSMDHPFHIHAWDFQVIDNGHGGSDFGWKDTVNIPSKSTVRIRINFADFGGTTVYHCHILDHEDNGMMGIVKVS